ncbi:MAG TPA: DUF2339 domain-containing protein [Candidatus Nanoarchaeia archaeon]|nr:DUF2339 domain-containing protein [Candidatus Nanoarchaeia archaeon]
MTAKPKENWSDYFNKLNKTLGSFERRIETLEKQVGTLSKKSGQATVETEVIYEGNPKRKLGWGLIWLGIFLFIGPWFLGFGSLRYLLPGEMTGILPLGSIIAGIVIIIMNPKSGKQVKKERREIDLGQDSLYPNKYKEEDKEESKAKDVSAKKSSKKSKSNFEADIGKKWLPKIGIISIVLGVAFFVIYAIQNKWIGPTGQVALGALAGISLIVAGDFFYRKKYYNYGMTIVGGGFAIIYFAMFAAYRFYSLLPLTADVGALTLIMIGTVFFSVKYNSKIIAAEAFFLGYIVPLLTSSVNTFFLMYAVALTAGLTALAYFKNWKILGAGGIAAMYITHIFWLDNYSGTDKNLLNIVFLFVYLLMFTTVALKNKDEPKGKTNEELEDFFTSRNLIGAVLIITYIFFFNLDFSKSLTALVPLSLMVLFLAFIVIKFRWNYFTAAGIIMTYIVHSKWLDSNLNTSSLYINFIALTIYFVFFNIILFLLSSEKNKASNVIAIVLNSGFYYGLNIWPAIHFDKGYQGLFTAALAIVYLVFAYIAYNRKISHYFNTYIVLCFGHLTLAVPLQFNREWVTISWAVLTFILVVLSFRLKENTIRISSSVVALITFGRLLGYDSYRLNPIDTSNFLNSTRLFAFLATIVLFYIIAYLYYKNKDKFEDYKNYVIYVNAAYAIAATLLTTIIIWLEIWDTSMMINAKKLWTSLAFILQAITILGFGFSAKIKLFRLMGLILFGLSILKVFLYDLSNLETGYRIISFIVLGVIALLGAFLYNKYKEYL